MNSYYEKNKVQILERTTQYRNNHKKEYAIMQIKRRALIRKRMFEILGDKCSGCGFSDKRALEFDHVDGGGYREYKKIGSHWLSKYVKNPELAKKTLRTFCSNCNMIARYEEDKKIRISKGYPEPSDFW